MKDEANKECIVDFGLQNPSKKGDNKLYGILKGAIDGGLIIPADDSIFPNEDKLFAKDKKEDMQKAFEQVKSKITK
jgi:hypothetical protein